MYIVYNIMSKSIVSAPTTPSSQSLLNIYVYIMLTKIQIISNYNYNSQWFTQLYRSTYILVTYSYIHIHKHI